ncbi:MAG: NADH-quinone oxidoreductase subunit NuoF [Acidobacteriota bacterium]
MDRPTRLGREDLRGIRARLRSVVDSRRRPPAPGAVPARRDVLVCAGGACVSCHSLPVADQLEREIAAAGLSATTRVVRVGCMGLCDAGPLVMISPDGSYYARVTSAAVTRIVDEHLRENKPVTDFELSWEGPEGVRKTGRDVPFFARQVKVALRNCGVVDPGSIDEYVALDGYLALEKILFELEPQEVIDSVKRSGLRGRGGAGFPTGMKWGFVREAVGGEKYVVCNGDEGDPGAFMDRSILEGDPHSVIEGMMIAGFVAGARQGYVYVRAEYPLAIERLAAAIEAARAYGLLGESILGSPFSFDIEIRIGAGAFVCGEETALLASIEGRRGMPRPRPPFPARAGLWGKPTLINNVETWANVPPIILRGEAWYSGIGTARSKGTKVFALAGAIRNTGLVEVPMGISLRDIVEEIGGGIRSGRPFKAAQSGGPSGGCIPASAGDTPIDFESLQELGAIMGSGGLVVLDEGTCMVELSRFFLDFLVDESCGKCPPCRIGTQIMLNLLERITKGQAAIEDLDTLHTLAAHIQRSSLCGLGQTAPNAVLSTLRHFRAEYETHVVDKKCPARQCKQLLIYTIIPDLCEGCGVCLKACPSGAITGEIKHLHVISQDLCIHCGACLTACPTDAVLAE